MTCALTLEAQRVFIEESEIERHFVERDVSRDAGIFKQLPTDDDCTFMIDVTALPDSLRQLSREPTCAAYWPLIDRTH